MVEPFAVGRFLVVPYRPFEGSTTKNDVLLDELASHPERFALPQLTDNARVNAAWHLSSADTRAWEVWSGKAFVGILLLSRIVPSASALWHFAFFDDALADKHELLTTFVGRCFSELKLERLGLEVPEHVTTLISFARRKLGFRYEGESRTINGTNKPAAWVSRQGSRREHAYFDGSMWHDLIVLRLLKDEV